MGSLFSRPKTPEPIVLPEPPVDDAAVRDAAAKEAERLRKRRGAASTILTGPQGVTSPAPVLKQRLGE